MGMTLKELLTKGEGTLTAGEAKTLASQCRMDVETLYTLLVSPSASSSRILMPRSSRSCLLYTSPDRPDIHSGRGRGSFHPLVGLGACLLYTSGKTYDTISLTAQPAPR